MKIALIKRSVPFLALLVGTFLLFETVSRAEQGGEGAEEFCRISLAGQDNGKVHLDQPERFSPDQLRAVIIRGRTSQDLLWTVNDNLTLPLGQRFEQKGLPDDVMKRSSESYFTDLKEDIVVNPETANTSFEYHLHGSICKQLIGHDGMDFILGELFSVASAYPEGKSLKFRSSK